MDRHIHCIISCIRSKAKGICETSKLFEKMILFIKTTKARTIAEYVTDHEQFLKYPIPQILWATYHS
jgi:hypothetical protein